MYGSRHIIKYCNILKLQEFIKLFEYLPINVNIILYSRYNIKLNEESAAIFNTLSQKLE